MSEKGGWGYMSPFMQNGPAYSRPDYPLGVMCEEIQTSHWESTLQMVQVTYIGTKFGAMSCHTRHFLWWLRHES